MDKRLSKAEYFAAGEYTITDVAIYPWLVSHADQGRRMSDYPSLARWFEAIGSRPAVKRALQVGADLRRPLGRDMDERTREILFGNRR